MKKKIFAAALGLGLLVSGPAYAASPTITCGENQSIVEITKEMEAIENDLNDICSQIEEASKRLDEMEERIKEIELLAQLIEAEAGNQDLYGRRLVGEVVLNRVRSGVWPNTIEGVIFQKGQFEVMRNGAFRRAGSHISETSREAARLAFADPTDPGIMYFATFKANGKGFWKHGGHWFSY